MYKTKIFIFLLLTITISSLSGNVLASTGHIENTNYKKQVDQCDNPTEFRAISTVDIGLRYNTSVINVPKNTCVQITFVDLQSIPHDFVIDADPSHNFSAVLIQLNSKTDGINGSNFLSQNVFTPNTNITYSYYCSMPGHSASMRGDFIVGAGSPTVSSSPGFEFIGLFSSLVALVTIIRIHKRN